MTAVAHPRDGLGPAWPASLVAAGFIAAGAGVILAQHQIRFFEARLSALVLAGTHVTTHAQSIGPVVAFHIGRGWGGLSLTAGCTAALLMTPFLLVGAGLLLARRIGVARSLVSIAAVAVIVFAVNQLRFLLIAGAMQVWGFQTGYERTHVLVGGLLSTFGVAVGVVVFLVALSTIAKPRPKASPQ